ncbi:MFS transporter [Sporolactobacillus pectinivorans]|uniref:MFS transporter n=1 Tax=Sporolactobacillus pectinivorans TaxID=1591408 RepID=UPI000C26A037|nr:MFS transporter [Sporolactobacillus pectinivorans]
MNTFMSLHRNIKTRLLTSFLSRFFGNMIFPFMAIYFAVAFGTATAGCLVLIIVIVSSVSSIYGGYIADCWGRKKVMVIAQGIQIVALVIMAIVNSAWLTSASVTFAMMLIQNISTGLLNPAAEAMLIDVSTPKNRQFIYSLDYWSTNLSIAVGTIIGGALFQHYRFILFSGLAVSSIVIFVLIEWLIKESDAVSKAPKINTLTGSLKELSRNYSTVMKDRLFVIFCISQLLVVSLEFQMNNYIAVRLQDQFRTVLFGRLTIDGLTMLSWIRVENTLLIVLCTLLINQWMRHYSPLHVLYLGILFYVSGYTLITFSNQWLVLLLSMLIASLGELMNVPVSQIILAELAGEHDRGAYMAVHGFVFKGAKIMGSLGMIVGAFISSYMMAVLFFCMGIAGLYGFYRITGKLKDKAAIVTGG